MENQQKFLELIRNPWDLNPGSLSFLEKMTAEYPYCQTLQILLAKNLQPMDKLAFEKQVNQASAYTIDRRKLQRYISDRDKPEISISAAPPTTEYIPTQQSVVQETLNPGFDTVQDLPATQNEEPITVPPVIQQPEPEVVPASPKPTADPHKLSLVEIVKLRLNEIRNRGAMQDKGAIKNKRDTTTETHPEPSEIESQEVMPSEQETPEILAIKLTGNRGKDLEEAPPPSETAEPDTETNQPQQPEAELQDKPKDEASQIEDPANLPATQPARTGKRADINYLIDKFLKEEPRIKVTKDLPEEQEDLSAPSSSDNSQLITETLALVYMKQGRKDKALDVYEKLCLKFPEKSSYFAKKIIDINNEINP